MNTFKGQYEVNGRRVCSAFYEVLAMTDWKALCKELLDAEEDQNVVNDDSDCRFRLVAERARALLAHPEAAGVMTDDALSAFTAWFCRNYPGPDTIIHKPEWHAPKVFRAAQHALDRNRAPVQPADGELAELVGAIEAEAREERDSGHLHWLTAKELTRIVALLQQHSQSPQLVAVGERYPDAIRMDALRDQSWDLRCFDMPTGQGDADIGWRVIQHHMEEPYERVVAQVYADDPRSAIDAAMRIPATPPEAV